MPNTIESSTNAETLNSSTRETVINEARYSYSPEQQRNISLVEITTTVSYKGDKYVVQGLRYDVPELGAIENETEPKPTITVVAFSGGSSDAYSAAHLLTRIRDGFADIGEELPYKLRVITLPHVVGSPRTAEIQGDYFNGASEILAQSLKSREFGLTDKVVLLGYSAGGSQVLGLAPYLKENLECVVLGDPCGLYDNPRLPLNFVLDSVSAFKDYFKEERESHGFGIRAVKNALKHTVAEMLSGLPSPEGRSESLIQAAKALSGATQNKYVKRVAAEAGVDTLKSGMDIKALSSDTTSGIREEVECPIIFSPQVGANVVNVLWTSLKEQIHSYIPDYTLEDFRELVVGRKDSEDFLDVDVRNLAEDKIRELFPKAKNVFIPSDSSSHGRAFVGNRYFDKLMWTVDKVLREELRNQEDKERVTTIL